VAAGKGNHKPAKDLLLHTDIIKPLNDVPSGSEFILCIGMPGAPAMPVPTLARSRQQQRRIAYRRRESRLTSKPDSADS